MRSRLWSWAETQILQNLIDTNKEAEALKAIPYRSPESIRHKIRQLKTKSIQNEAEEMAGKSFIESLKELGPVQARQVTLQETDELRELEVCLFDSHFGMHCFTPDSDAPWDMDICEETCLWAIESLLRLAEPYGPYQQIIFPFGNDFLHADNIQHTTTAGTSQPEMESWHETFRRGKELAIRMVERLKQVAPVQVYQIPGNHSLQSDYTIGIILDAYYHNDENVNVDCSSSQYKFHRFGNNLIGYEHGSAVSTIRLAALMANERPTDWAETTYREFHLGDQHRKGSSLPSMLEEQGVSIEYITGITPPNNWHRSKGFNHQKRGATGFVWDYHRGQIARLSVNLNPYTGKPMGI